MNTKCEKYGLDTELKKGTSYPTLMGELMSVFYKYLGVKWPGYKEVWQTVTVVLLPNTGYSM